MVKKNGILGNHINGAVPANETFDTERFNQEQRNKRVQDNKKNDLKQKVSMKINKGIADELHAIKITQKIKFDYEVIQFLIDNYKSDLSPEAKRSLTMLRDSIR